MNLYFQVPDLADCAFDEARIRICPQLTAPFLSVTQDVGNGRILNARLDSVYEPTTALEPADRDLALYEALNELMDSSA